MLGTWLLKYSTLHSKIVLTTANKKLSCCRYAQCNTVSRLMADVQGDRSWGQIIHGAFKKLKIEENVQNLGQGFQREVLLVLETLVPKFQMEGTVRGSFKRPGYTMGTSVKKQLSVQPPWWCNTSMWKTWYHATEYMLHIHCTLKIIISL